MSAMSNTGDTMDKGKGAVVHIGHGGWSIHYRKVGNSTSTLSHYGSTWIDHVDELEDGAYVVDTREMPDLVTWAISGPMLNVEVKRGEIWSFSATREIDRSARFYGARSLDYISVEDWVDLAREMGALVYDAREHAETVRELEASLT